MLFVLPFFYTILDETDMHMDPLVASIIYFYFE